MLGNSSQHGTMKRRPFFGAGPAWRIRLSAIQWLILTAAALVIAITLGTGYFAMQYRERALEVAERELNNSALLLSRHFDQQLLDLQHVQEDVVNGLRADGVHTADDFETKMSTLSTHELLRRKLSVLPYVGALNLWSAKGSLVNSSEMWPVAGSTITDRRYYREFMSDEPTPDVIVEAVVSKVTKVWTTIFARKITGRERRDHRLCGPRRRAFSLRELRRLAGAGQRHRDLDDPPRRHRHRTLPQGRQADRPERREFRRVSAGARGGRQHFGTLHQREIPG